MKESTLELIEAARQVLESYHPMTLRQCYYQLVSNYKDLLKNDPKEYKRLSVALVKARQEGMIPWEWLEDRTRQPKVIDMYARLSDFVNAAKEWYHRDVWPDQPGFVVVWVEKDALSGIFWKHCGAFGVPLIVGRGYNSWSIRKEVADMIETHQAEDRETTILYFGDFDPSGEDIVRDLRDSFEVFGLAPEVIKVALTPEQIEKYGLPPDFAKKSDARAAKFIALHGEKSAVELDALPPQVLGQMIEEAVKDRLDMSAMRRAWQGTREDRVKLIEAFRAGGQEV